MKKKLEIFCLLMLTLSFTHCTKDCGLQDQTCFEVPPQQELCLAYFERWFYNSKNDRCEMIAYSGCSLKGFASKEECNFCACR
jgi:hypothetical protein